MENTISGQYYFAVGSFEKNGFRNSNLKDSKYMGRFKTKLKYLGLLGNFGVTLIHKKTLKYEEDIEFYNRYGDYIIGDVFFIEDEEIFNQVDKLYSYYRNYTIKENIIVENIETKECLECFTYFKNCKNLEKEIKLYQDTTNEYTIENKIRTMELLVQLDALKGNDKMSEWFIKLEQMKASGQDLSKLIL